MAGSQRRGGIIQLQVDGVLQDVHGAFKYSLGTPERSEIIGSGKVLGYSEKPSAAFIEGVFIDKGTFDAKAMFNATDVTVTMPLANGKSIVLRDAWQANPFVGETEEGKLEVRFVSSSEGEEVTG